MNTEDIKRFIVNLLGKMNIGVDDIEVTNSGGRECFSVRTPDSYMLIGTRGAHLFALNHIVKKIVSSKAAAKKASGQAVSENPKESRGIVLGFSGQGEAVVANRYRGVRAAVFYGEPQGVSEVGQKRTDKPKNMIVLSREDDDANVLAIAAGFISDNQAKEALKLWLEAPFRGEERHERRIKKIDL